MNILIVGPTNSGKSRLGDLIRNTIFRLDKEAKIVVHDSDRSKEPFGNGSNVYDIEVFQRPVTEIKGFDQSELGKDVVIILSGHKVAEWLREIS